MVFQYQFLFPLRDQFLKMTQFNLFIHSINSYSGEQYCQESLKKAVGNGICQKYSIQKVISVLL